MNSAARQTGSLLVAVTMVAAMAIAIVLPIPLHAAAMLECEGTTVQKKFCLRRAFVNEEAKLESSLRTVLQSARLRDHDGASQLRESHNLWHKFLGLHCESESQDAIGGNMMTEIELKCLRRSIAERSEEYLELKVDLAGGKPSCRVNPPKEDLAARVKILKTRLIAQLETAGARASAEDRRLRQDLPKMMKSTFFEAEALRHQAQQKFCEARLNLTCRTKSTDAKVRADWLSSCSSEVHTRQLKELTDRLLMHNQTVE